jgi:DNA-binding response OmpR family regulator
MIKVLLLDDEVALANQISLFLSKRNYQVQTAHRLDRLNTLLQAQSFDLLILDRMLPDGELLDHFDDIKAMHEGPVIIMTALGMSNNKVEGYRAGADYYLTKPIDLDELLAILEHLSKKVASINAQNSTWVLEEKSLLDPIGLSVTITPREKMILQVLMSKEGEMVTKNDLIASLGFDVENYDFRRLDTALYRLRQKVEKNSDNNFPLQTVYGLGYVWQEIQGSAAVQL